ncbi:hypothetical protein BDQ17DRAFT_1353533 [Cyathus striatus]|nr:hypothetical protein BDQ17DRAFT_1353533 [Cyathus striatus]
MASSYTVQSYAKGGKVDMTPKRHHGYAVILFIMGTLFPPLAVAARFGIGKDFWLNLLLTICDISHCSGHGHNFYIQNIRNNKNHARTPKWVQKYGLVDTSDIKRKERRSQWASRYNERLPHSTLEGQAYEEGQEAGDGSGTRRHANGDLWRPEDESYYNSSQNSITSSSSRWHYPANFDDAVVPAPAKKSKKKKDKKDRWARTQDAYSVSEETTTRRKKSKKKSRSSVGTDDADTISRESVNEFPEDAEGGLYGERPRTQGVDSETKDGPKNTTDDVFQHEF